MLSRRFLVRIQVVALAYRQKGRKSRFSYINPSKETGTCLVRVRAAPIDHIDSCRASACPFTWSTLATVALTSANKTIVDGETSGVHWWMWGADSISDTMSLRSLSWLATAPFSKDWISKIFTWYVFYNRYCYISMTFRKDEKATNIAQLGEHHAVVVLEVTGSNPVIRFRQVAEWYTRR